jgi:hypothetical protein
MGHHSPMTESQAEHFCQNGKRGCCRSVRSLGSAPNRGKWHLRECTLNSKLNTEIEASASPSRVFDILPAHEELPDPRLFGQHSDLFELLAMNTLLLSSTSFREQCYHACRLLRHGRGPWDQNCSGTIDRRVPVRTNWDRIRDHFTQLMQTISGAPAHSDEAYRPDPGQFHASGGPLQ